MTDELIVLVQYSLISFSLQLMFVANVYMHSQGCKRFGFDDGLGRIEGQTICRKNQKCLITFQLCHAFLIRLALAGGQNHKYVLERVFHVSCS